MEALPSYEEATTAPHWLQLAAPYVPAIDWRRCSLVNNDFYSQFAPLLWLDPLVTARTYGLHPNDGTLSEHGTALCSGPEDWIGFGLAGWPH